MTLRSNCKATYIDSYSYLTNTGFTTRDGVRYNLETLEQLKTFISSEINPQSSKTFLTIVRDRKGLAPKLLDDDFIYWIPTALGGLNECTVQLDGKSVLPDSTGYAWGRFYEIIGERPALDTNDSSKWWSNSLSDTYKRGSIPKVGAVICWKHSKENKGYVGIVEAIDEVTGEIIVSESPYRAGIYDPQKDFIVTRRNNKDGQWGMKDTDYFFQGFIYCPTVTEKGTIIDNISKSDVVSIKGKYLGEAAKQKNARYICKILVNKYGWTLNAVAGLLGNLEHESTINPGLTEFGGSGYGLVQWTPPTKFTNWCDKQNPKLPHDDVDSQLAMIDWEMKNNKQYSYKLTDYYGVAYDPPPEGPKLFKDFATSTKSAYTLACAFVYNYERPGSIIYGAWKNKNTGKSAKTVGREIGKAGREKNRASVRDKRGNAATKWYNFFVNNNYYASGVNFQISAFKAGIVEATKAICSFIVSNGSEYTYTLFKNNKKIYTGSANLEKTTFVANFTLNNLVPNTSYTVTIEVKDSNGTQTEFATTTFKTPQEHPNSVTNISIKNEGLSLQ